MKLITTALIFFVVLNAGAQTPVSKVFKLKWKAPIGTTTYRTNMIFYEGKLYIGSNGRSRDNRNDPQDGVYEINAKTGKITHQFITPYAGDNDVTGIEIADNKLFFGSDNFTFFCYDLNTKQELWKKALPYDVESAPVTEDFNRDGIMDVFFSVERYGFYALNGKDGSVIWEKDSVSSNAGNSKALLLDINGDGVKDIVSSMRGEPNSNETAGFKMAHYGDYHWALDGTNGHVLWTLESGAGIHSSPYMFEINGQKRLALQDCYGEFQISDLQGNRLSRAEFGYGLFSTPVMTKDQHLILGNFSVEYRDDLLDYDSVTQTYYLSNRAGYKTVEGEGPISATTMLADVLGKGSVQGVGVSEAGWLFIMKTDGTTLHKLKIGKGAEASVFIKDIDGDGKLELLIADLDGFLYCYDTVSDGPVDFGEF